MHFVSLSWKMGTILSTLKPMLDNIVLFRENTR